MHLPSVLQLFSALSLRLWCTTTTTIINANETDRLALLAIKSQLHDPLEVTSSLTNSVNLCEWTGVTCGHRHQRVTKFINIADNGVQGEIPNELGTIPTNLSLRSKLMLFFANRNILAGEIPAEIGNLFKLEKLSFCVIKLTGQLPASIQNLSSHLEADLNRNNFGGKIPESPDQLRSLFYLKIGGNQFSGMFLPVYNLSSLEMIYLHDNRFNGNLPLDIGAKLPNLRKIVIALNNFTGPLPDSFFNASNLERLELSYNQFRGKVLSGSLPLEVGNLKNVVVLDLSVNQFPKSGDLKPSNVLLDHDMVAHVGDFGLARFLSDIPLCTVPEIQSSSIGIKGTVDCSMVWEASLPGDLCSFGVMLLEMFIRRRPTDNAFSEGLTLHEYAKITMQEKVMEIIDSSLKS
ncbi:hypothetical protein CUMW_188680 [Citrus unshiu]|nr:hypothetical protein CUMW_188680 [Citrus unshiu]